MGVADQADQPIATAEAPSPAAPGAVGTRGRVAGRGQAILLLAGSCLPILGALLIAPVLPDLQKYFEARGVSGASTLAPIALSIPSLAVGLIAPFAGRIIDAVGRKRLLLWSLPLYVIAGTAPLYLNVLPAIIVSRALIGVAEAAIMTCCVTLLGDYYSGKDRDRYLALQATTAAFSAVVFLGVGGALGENGWRTPFWLYLSGLLFLPLFAKFIWSPTKTEHSPDLADGLSGVPWKRITPLLIISLLGAIVFYALQVELSFVLDDLNASTGAIGASAALANLGLAIAAVVFGIYNRGKASAWLVVGMFLAGFGLFLLALGHNWLAVTGGAIVAGVGGGLILPSLLVGTTSLLRFEQRGRGTGAWTGAFYLGQFISPIVVNGLKAGTGELTTALKIIGVFGVVLSVACYLLVRRTPLTTNSTPTIALAAAEAVEPPLPTFEAPETEPTTAASTVGGSDADVAAEAVEPPAADSDAGVESDAGVDTDAETAAAAGVESDTLADTDTDTDTAADAGAESGAPVDAAAAAGAESEAVAVADGESVADDATATEADNASTATDETEADEAIATADAADGDAAVVDADELVVDEAPADAAMDAEPELVVESVEVDEIALVDAETGEVEAIVDVVEVEVTEVPAAETPVAEAPTTETPTTETPTTETLTTETAATVSEATETEALAEPEEPAETTELVEVADVPTVVAEAPAAADEVEAATPEPAAGAPAAARAKPAKAAKAKPAKAKPAKA